MKEVDIPFKYLEKDTTATEKEEKFAVVPNTFSNEEKLLKVSYSFNLRNPSKKRK